MATKEHDTLKKFERKHRELLEVAFSEKRETNCYWMARGMELAYKILFGVSTLQFEIDMIKLEEES